MKKIIIAGIAALVFIIAAIALFFPSAQTTPDEPFALSLVWFYKAGEVSAGDYTLGETIEAHGILDNYARRGDAAHVVVTMDLTTPQGVAIPRTDRRITLTQADGTPQEFRYTLNSAALEPGAYLLSITATDTLRDETAAQVVPLFIDEPTALTLIGPFAGNFNAATAQFIENPQIYNAGDSIEFYYEIRGMSNAFDPQVRVSLLVADEQGDIVDVAPVANFNVTYSEPIAVLEQSFSYDTSTLEPGTYYLRFRAQDDSEQDQSTIRVVLQ